MGGQFNKASLVIVAAVFLGIAIAMFAEVGSYGNITTTTRIVVSFAFLIVAAGLIFWASRFKTWFGDK